MDPFEIPKTEVFQPPPPDTGFPDLNTQWLPPFEEGVKTKTGKNLEKGSDILKKAMSLYWFGLGLTALIIILPAMLRFLYEFSNWAYENAGTIFP